MKSRLVGFIGLTLLGLGAVHACAEPPPPNTSAQHVSGADCVTSFDCDDSEVCRAGVCGPPDDAECFWFEPNSSEAFSPAAAPSPDSVQSNPEANDGVTQRPDDEQNRAEFLALLKAGPVRRALDLAYADHASLLPIAQEEARATWFLEEQMLPVYSAGIALRQGVKDLEKTLKAWDDHEMAHLAGLVPFKDTGGETADGCEAVFDYELQPDRLQPTSCNLCGCPEDFAVRSGSDQSITNACAFESCPNVACSPLVAGNIRNAFRECTERARDVLSDLQKIADVRVTPNAAANTNGYINPTLVARLNAYAGIFDRIKRTTSWQLGNPELNAISLPVKSTFPSCAQYVRAREYAYAISTYGHYTRAQASVIEKDLQPLADLPVPWYPHGGNTLYSGYPTALGALAAEFKRAGSVRTHTGERVSSRSRVLLDALEVQKGYLDRLAADSPPVTLEQLLEVTLVAEPFLQQRPEFRDIYEGTLREYEKKKVARLYRGIGLGLGCMGGTALATAYTGTAALVIGTGAGIICVADFLDSFSPLIEARHLYQLGLTYRYFGVSNTLAAYDKVRALEQNLASELLFTGIGAAGGVFDILETTKLARRAMRQMLASRGIRSYEAADAALSEAQRIAKTIAANRSVLASEHAYQHAIDIPINVNTQDQLLAWMKASGRIFAPFHGGARHVPHVAAQVEQVLLRVGASEKDVQLGILAALFHDAVRNVDFVTETLSDGTTKILKAKPLLKNGLTSEQASADLAERWMRAQNAANPTPRFSEDDITRVWQAIVHGTTVKYVTYDDLVAILNKHGMPIPLEKFDPSDAHGGGTLLPAAYLDNPSTFFSDPLVYAMSVADLGDLARLDANQILHRVGQLALEDNPWIMTDIIRGAWPSIKPGPASDAASAVFRSLMRFQPSLVKSRRWFAMEAWSGKMNASREALGQALWNFADPNRVEPALLDLANQAQSADIYWLLEKLQLIPDRFGRLH